MFVLTQQACSHHLIRTLNPVRIHFKELLVACYASGHGPWDDIVHKHESPEVLFSFVFPDGPLYGEDAKKRLGSPAKFDLTASISTIHNEFFQNFGLTLDARPENCAIILRPNAFIVLTSDRGNSYVQYPDASTDVTGHELMDDPNQLNREYPGRFHIV